MSIATRCGGATRLDCADDAPLLKRRIAERERAQSELTLRNTWQTTILDNTPVEIVLRDRDGIELVARPWEPAASRPT